MGSSAEEIAPLGGLHLDDEKVPVWIIIVKKCSISERSVIEHLFSGMSTTNWRVNYNNLSWASRGTRSQYIVVDPK